MSVIDFASGKTLAEIPVGIEPEGMAFSPDGKLAVATSESTSMAHVIDTSTYKLIANVLVDTRPRAALFEDSGKRFWVTSEVGGTLSVIDAATFTSRQEASASRSPACAPS